jgi:hypothetical protein
MSKEILPYKKAIRKLLENNQTDEKLFENTKPGMGITAVRAYYWALGKAEFTTSVMLDYGLQTEEHARIFKKAVAEKKLSFREFLGIVAGDNDVGPTLTSFLREKLKDEPYIPDFESLIDLVLAL